MRTRLIPNLSCAATVVVALAAALLAGCGTKGPLYVPVHQPDAPAPAARPAVTPSAEPIVAPAAPAAATSSDSKSTAAPAVQ